MKPTLILLAMATAASFASAEVTETIDQTHPLSANGMVRLSNVNGTVEIKAWDRNEVHLVARKTAESPEALAAIQVQVEAKASRIVIRTDMGRHKGRNNAVHYTLQVPAGAAVDGLDAVNADVVIDGVRGRVEAQTVNGNLNVSGLVGNATLESTNGNITAAVGPLTGQNISCRSVNGSCTLVIPEELNASVLATSGNGSVHSEVPLRVRRSSRNYLKGDFGEGGGFVELNTINGNIEIRREA